MGCIAMMMHRWRSNNGLDYKRLKQYTVTMDRHRLAMSWSQMTGKLRAGTSARLRRALTTAFGHQRTQTITSLSPNYSKEAAPSFSPSASSPSILRECMAYIQSLHSSGATCGDAVPVACCMLTIALAAIILLRKNALSKLSNRWCKSMVA